MQSGVLADCLGPVPLWSSRVQGDFDRLVKRFGLEDQDDQGKVDGLRAVPINDLIKAATELGYSTLCQLLTVDRSRSFHLLYEPKVEYLIAGRFPPPRSVLRERT